MLPSKEQLEIINNIDKFNICVDSVPGSGKTTTNIFIAEKYVKKKIVLLTFNKKLTNETKTKLKNKKITNMEAYTYHGFCTQKFKIQCPDDKGIEDALKSKQKINFDYDIIILDESQDIYELFYKLICKIISLNKKDYTICILGDKNQNIYDFKGADSRYLTKANEIFNFNGKEWKNIKLSTSYRLTKPMASFMNECIINEERIVSIKEGEKIEYHILNIFKDFKIIIKEILNVYDPEDIFILAPSVKTSNSNNPLTEIENFIVKELKKLVYIPLSDETELDEEIIKNKLVFSSFHQSKGLERKVVICYNIDNSYFEYHAKEYSSDTCPNTIYVALSRATERLIIFHDKKKKFMPFINKTNLLNKKNVKLYDYYSKFENSDNINKLKEIQQKKKIHQVTNFIKFLPQIVINDLINTKLTKEEIKKGTELKLNSSLSFIDCEQEYKENVSSINGIVLPMYYEYKTTKNIRSIDILKKIYEYYLDVQQTNNKKIKKEKSATDENIFSNELKFIEDIHINNIKIEDIIKSSIYFDAYLTKYIHPTKQIKKFNWITYSQLEESNKRFKRIIGQNANYEVEVSINNYDNEGNIIKGFIDCIDEKNFYEFKYVTEIKDEHVLQLCLYIFMFANNKNIKTDEELQKYNFFIFNIRYDHIIKINTSLEKLKNIYDTVINIKLNGYFKLIDDDSFLKKCRIICAGYIDNVCKHNFLKDNEHDNEILKIGEKIEVNNDLSNVSNKLYIHNVMEYIVYYKTDGLIFRSYNALTKQFENLSRLPTNISNFYLPKKYEEGSDANLIKYSEDLKKDTQSLLLHINYNYIEPYGKQTCRTHFKNVENFYFMHYPKNYSRDFLKPITKEETILFSKCYNDYQSYIKQGIYEVFGYNYKAFYQNILVSEDFYMPHCKGEFKNLNKIPKNIMLGFYYVKISCDDEDFKKIFMFSKDNVYTSHSLKFAIKYKEKFNINIELIEQKNNAYVYDRKKHCIQSKILFKDWSDRINELKKQIPNNGLLKMLSSSLWGHLSRKKKMYLTEQETDDLKADWSNNCRYKILSYEIKQNGEDFFKVIDTENPYYHNFARLKPFITSYGRVKIAEMALKIGLDKIVRICCDSICTLEKIDFKDDFFIPEEKTTGRFLFERNNKPLTHC